MSGLDALVNAVLLPGYGGRAVPDWLLRASDNALAGAVMFAHNVGGAPLLLREDALIAIDEEGGSVTRVQSASGSSLPSAWQLGIVDDVSATRTVGARLAAFARSVGANLLFAPDADVNVNPRNPVIGTRSFSADSATVSRHVAAMVAGIAAGGAGSCAKHWPGHGDTSQDSHMGAAVSLAAEGDLEAHVAPFRAAIEAGVAAIMTAHIRVPMWGDAPATTLPRAINELHSLGFERAIVSDALDMRAVNAQGIGTAAVQALLAGCDLLCIGNPHNPGADGDGEAMYLEARTTIADAVRAGELPLARLEAATARVAATRSAVAATSASSAGISEEAALALVARALSWRGEVPAMPDGRHVMDARPAPTWAESTRAAELVATLTNGTPASDSPTIVLVDRLADERQYRLAEAAVACGAACVVNLGVPVATELPTLEVGATSRVSAIAAHEALSRGSA